MTAIPSQSTLPIPEKGSLSQAPKPAGIRLRPLLVLPLVALPVAAAGITAMLSLINSRQAINDVVEQLQREVSLRIENQLTNFLQTPVLITQLNARAVQRGDIKIADSASERYLWQQIQLLENIQTIYYGSQADGAIVGVDRSGSTGFSTSSGDANTNFLIRQYSIDEQGNRLRLERTIPNRFDSRRRPWYQAAVQAGQSIFSPVYADFGTGQLVITTATPVTNGSDEIQGVSAADLALTELNSFLSSVSIGQGGRSFILEKATGNLIATSTGEPLQSNEGNQTQRRKISESEDLLIQGAGSFLIRQFGDLTLISNPDQLEFFIKDQRHYVEVVPFTDARGIDWLIGVVVPESDFLGEINANTRLTILLTIAAALLATAVGIWIANRITKPMAELSQASAAFAAGSLDKQVQEANVFELGQLARSFNQMAAQLRQSFQEIEQRSAQITLQEEQTRYESEVLQNDVGHILDVVASVEEGDLTVQAEVNDRATGLVSDTLNRLVEQLTQILSTVQASAIQVTQGSEQLEQLAQIVAQNASQQANEVGRVLALTDAVEETAQDTATQVARANQTVQQAQNQVAQGQVAIQTLTQDITTLQQGTARLLQSREALEAFLTFTNLVVKEQAQTASLTQTLAMSAELLSARASAQQDPRQMLALAREFEALGKQVKLLAQQTSDSLKVLQQRTNEVQGTVNSIDSEVQSLSDLVQGFTKGVDRSRQAFAQVETATQQVTGAFVAVNDSSQKIVDAANSTVAAIQSIAELAQQTATLTQDTRRQSENMEALSAQLLQRIQYFKLPTSSNEPIHKA